jgi:hypothetical protein
MVNKVNHENQQIDTLPNCHIISLTFAKKLTHWHIAN